MKLSCKDLPSKGLGSNYDGTIEIDLLTYYDVLKYISDGMKLKSNSIAQLSRDIEFILAPRVPQYKDLSSYDLNFLICLRKLYSIINEGSFKYDGVTYSLSEVRFSEMEESIMRACGVLDKPFRIATIGEVVKTIENCPVEYFDLDCELAILATDMGITIPELLEYSSRSTATIEYMRTKVVSHPIVGGEEDIVLFGKSSDLFRNLTRFSTTDQLEIRYNEVQ